MTEEQIREAGAAAVADFPPLTDEVAARLGALLADLDKLATEVEPREQAA